MGGLANKIYLRVAEQANRRRSLSEVMTTSIKLGRMSFKRTFSYCPIHFCRNRNTNRHRLPVLRRGSG